MTKVSRGLLVIPALLLGAACRPAPAPAPAPEATKEVAVPEAARIDAMAARFAPVDIAADLSTLPANEQQALAKLVEAARVMDTLFLRQVWAGNETLLLDLLKDGSPTGRARLHYFLINKGPWSRLDGNEPFVPGVPPKPAEANFYPAGATKDEVDAWMKKLPEAQRQHAAGFFTTIRRTPSGFVAVPYSLEYQGELARAAALLRDAAALTAQPTLKAFLDGARGRVRVERLLRERPGVDGARQQHRTHDRPVRGVRGRVVQRESGLRGVHRRPRRGRVAEAREVRRRAAGTSRTTCRSIRSTATRNSAA